MNKFFPIPLYSFCKTIYKNGGLSRRGLLHALPWIIKTTALEPLRWCELALYHKKLKSYKIEKGPLFILGYYRSGTTHLQQMFMQDDRLGYTSLYQTIFPELMLSFEKSMTPVLEKIAEVFRTQNHFHRIPLTWYSPGEEDVAMVSLMNSNAAQWGILFPHKAIEIFKKYALFQNIPNKELINWGEDYLYLLKKISLANKGKPLVLKSPLNTVRIQQLLWLFPNARFIYISRNPVDVYASTQRLWKMIIKKYVLGNYSEINIQNIILETYTSSVDQYMKDRVLIQPGRLIEISYENFIKQPVYTVEQIYDKLQLAGFDYCKEAMREYVYAQKDYKTLCHKLNNDELNSVLYRLGPYINYWKQIKENTQHETIIP